MQLSTFLFALPMAAGFSVLPSSMTQKRVLRPEPSFTSDLAATPKNQKGCSYAQFPHLDLVTNEQALNFSSQMEDLFAGRSSCMKQLAGDWDHQIKYRNYANGFNRRFNFKPNFVLYCNSTEDVRTVFLTAIENNLPIRIRSGGHDHEGESTGDGVVVIDVSGMNHTERVGDTDVFNIGPGNCFYKVTEDLAEHGRMLAHGTCGSVNVAGFTMGGGWGPWTRKYGMNCERMVGATVVLGDGTIVETNKTHLPNLLWALKGGGGFSYGLVTNLQIDTFPLPETLMRFNITWNPYEGLEDFPEQSCKTMWVLDAWQNIINSESSPQLIGTNLQITAQPGETEDDPWDKYHNCVMYGYWEGSEEELIGFVENWLGNTNANPYILKINPNFGGTGPYQQFNDWHRIDTAPALQAALNSRPDDDFTHILSDEELKAAKEGKPLPPDNDMPAPHKITNRLADAQGLGETGREQLVRSLTSNLCLKGNRKLGLNMYTTLGAIAGDYYHDEANRKNDDSSFPFKDRCYTIQYQTWWNTKIQTVKKLDDDEVYTRTNRALDWMHDVRDYDIPNTSGAFISFKDSSVPTYKYFGDSYEKLIAIKKEYSLDPLNHFRSGKTII